MSEKKDLIETTVELELRQGLLIPLVVPANVKVVVYDYDIQDESNPYVRITFTGPIEEK